MMIRELDVIEYTSWCVEQVFPHNCAIVGKLSCIVDANVIQEAVDVLLDKYVSLKSCIVATDGILNFHYDSNAGLQVNNLEKTHDHQADEIMRSELLIPFNLGQAPLIRVFHLYSKTNSELVLIVHHAILDALSMVSILDTLLNLVVSCHTATHEPMPFPKPIDARVDIDGKIKPVELVRKAQTDAPVSSTEMISVQIPESDYASLLTIGKSLGVTLQDHLAAACAMSISEFAHQQTGEVYINTPIDLRRYFTDRHSSFEIGFYSYYVDSNLFIPSDKEIPELAYDLNQLKNNQLSDQSPCEQLDKTGKFLSSLSSLDEISQMTKVDRPGFCLSNVGRLNISERYRDLELVDVYLSYNCHGFYQHEDTFSLIVSTFRNTLRLNLHYSKPWVTDAKAQAYLNRICDYLRGS